MELRGWEYKIDRQSVELSQESESLERIQDALNDEGSDGWEVVSVLSADIHDDVVDLMVFYKRPAERRPPATTISTEQMNELVDEAKDLLEKRRHEPP
jgi:Domain of unknown function (DUF4177)